APPESVVPQDKHAGRDRPENRDPGFLDQIADGVLRESRWEPRGHHGRLIWIGVIGAGFSSHLVTISTGSFLDPPLDRNLESCSTLRVRLGGEPPKR